MCWLVAGAGPEAEYARPLLGLLERSCSLEQEQTARPRLLATECVHHQATGWLVNLNGELQSVMVIVVC
jgi:hypothetical protein